MGSDRFHIITQIIDTENSGRTLEGRVSGNELENAYFFATAMFPQMSSKVHTTAEWDAMIAKQKEQEAQASGK